MTKNLTIIYRIPKGTQVLVADSKYVMKKHVMKHSREFRADTRLGKSFPECLRFTAPGGTQKWSLAQLENTHMSVFVTGHRKWPYLIIGENYLQGTYEKSRTQ